MTRGGGDPLPRGGQELKEGRPGRSSGRQEPAGADVTSGGQTGHERPCPLGPQGPRAACPNVPPSPARTTPKPTYGKCSNPACLRWPPFLRKGCGCPWASRGQSPAASRDSGGPRCVLGLCILRPAWCSGVARLFCRPHLLESPRFCRLARPSPPLLPQSPLPLLSPRANPHPHPKEPTWSPCRTWGAPGDGSRRAGECPVLHKHLLGPPLCRAHPGTPACEEEPLPPRPRVRGPCVGPPVKRSVQAETQTQEVLAAEEHVLSRAASRTLRWAPRGLCDPSVPRPVCSSRSSTSRMRTGSRPCRASSGRPRPWTARSAERPCLCSVFTTHSRAARPRGGPGTLGEGNGLHPEAGDGR